MEKEWPSHGILAAIHGSLVHARNDCHGSALHKDGRLDVLEKVNVTVPESLLGLM